MWHRGGQESQPAHCATNGPARLVTLGGDQRILDPPPPRARGTRLPGLSKVPENKTTLWGLLNPRGLRTDTALAAALRGAPSVLPGRPHPIPPDPHGVSPKRPNTTYMAGDVSRGMWSPVVRFHQRVPWGWTNRDTRGGGCRGWSPPQPSWAGSRRAGCLVGRCFSHCFQNELTSWAA